MRESCATDSRGTKEPSRPTRTGWRGALDVALAVRRERTVVERAVHEGPLRIQRAFYPEGEDTAHLYLLHPPGGVVGGDVLELSALLHSGSRALITTPGASKLYRSQGDTATLTHHFTVDSKACLEWLPQETIAFSGCRARITTKVSLARDATAVLWDVLCLGRPAADERFEHGELRTSYEVRREGALRFSERARICGGAALLHQHFGMQGQPVVGTFLIAAANAPTEAWLELVRERVFAAQGLVAASVVSGVFVLRYLGASARDARRAFELAYSLLRPLYAGRQAVSPRIWNT